MLGMEFTHLSHLDATMWISLCVCESASRDMNTLAIENRGRFIINATMRMFKKSEPDGTRENESEWANVNNFWHQIIDKWKIK